MHKPPEMTFVSKGWGWERWIVNKDEYCGKLLYIAKDRKCSLHYHKLKDETFYLQSGKILVFFSDDLDVILQFEKNGYDESTLLNYCDTQLLEPGDHFYVPRGRVHRMYAQRDSELFEFSTQHFDSDSHRIIKGD